MKISKLLIPLAVAENTSTEENLFRHCTVSLYRRSRANIERNYFRDISNIISFRPRQTSSGLPTEMPRRHEPGTHG